MEITGIVNRKQVAKRSKSKQTAITLDWNGKTYLLRQRGKNAFNNAELESLAGKSIQAVGEVVGNVFFIRTYTILH